MAEDKKSVKRREKKNIPLEEPDEFLLYLMLASNSWQEALSQIKNFKKFGLIQCRFKKNKNEARMTFEIFSWR